VFQLPYNFQHNHTLKKIHKNLAKKNQLLTSVFFHFQDVLRDQGCLPRISKLLELQRMAMWLRHSGASTSVSVTINAITNLATNEKNNKEMEVSYWFLLCISIDNFICYYFRHGIYFYYK
jgi:hypothetical protein